MKISERILLQLKDEPKTTKQLRHAIADKHPRCIAATISNNSEIFLRLDKSVVGLRNRDEHLVKDWKKKGLPLYKKMVNCLQENPKTLKELYAILPNEKHVSIRAIATVYPHLFIRLAREVIGRKNRDEYLAERYVKVKSSIRKEREIKRQTVAELLEIVLADGPKTMNQIRRLLPQVNYNLLTCKLSLGKQFVNDGGRWKLSKEKFSTK